MPNFAKSIKKMDEKEPIERDYKKEYQSQKAFVVVLNCVVVGTFRNLKKLCDEMKENDSEFRSYSSLSKKRDGESPLKFTTEKGEYQIYIEVLK